MDGVERALFIRVVLFGAYVLLAFVCVLVPHSLPQRRLTTSIQTLHCQHDHKHCRLRPVHFHSAYGCLLNLRLSKGMEATSCSAFS